MGHTTRHGPFKGRASNKLIAFQGLQISRQQNDSTSHDSAIEAGSLDRLAHAHFICQNATTHIGVLLVAHPCQTCASMSPS